MNAAPQNSGSIHSNAEELQRLYAKRFDGQAEYRNAVWQRICTDLLAQWIQPSDTVVDLGAGHGEFINAVTAQRKIALDLNPDLGSLVGPDVELLIHDCCTPWPLGDDGVDVVFTSNFLEHLPTKDHVLAALREANRVLRPGGRLIALGPNARFVGGKYWDYFDHHIPLTERSLGEACESAGFEIVKSLPRVLPYTMSGKRQAPIAFVSAYLRLPFAWSLFGQQFLVVATRQ